jgi:hypothetical protein
MTQLNEKIRILEMPDRMKRLRIDERGFPVPWFVPYVDGKPEFRAFDDEKFGIAVRHRRCWLCGEQLGVHLTFVLGPMCMVNRTNGEPPCHYDCAHYSVQACPFLSQPRMRRNEKDMPESDPCAGYGLKRNPGVVALWTTRSYKLFRAPMGGKGYLFTIGDPERIEYYAEGRTATRDEIMTSMESGLPLLMKIAEQEGREAVDELQRKYAQAIELIPANDERRMKLA